MLDVERELADVRARLAETEVELFLANFSQRDIWEAMREYNNRLIKCQCYQCIRYERRDTHVVAEAVCRFVPQLEALLGHLGVRVSVAHTQFDWSTGFEVVEPSHFVLFRDTVAWSGPFSYEYGDLIVNAKGRDDPEIRRMRNLVHELAMTAGVFIL